MSDADRKVTVQVKTEGDPSGAKTVEQGVQNVKKATEEAAKVVEKLSEQQQQAAKAAETAIKQEETALEGASQAAERNNESTEKGGKNLKELREIIKHLSMEFPLLGTIGRLALNPLVGAIGLISVVAAKGLESIHELANRSTPEFEGLTAAIERQKDAIENVELAANALQRALSRAVNAGASVQEHTQNHLDGIKRRADAEKDLQNKRQDLEAATIDEAEKFGVITHEQAIIKKLALDEKYAQMRLALEKRVAEQELSARFIERANNDIQARTIEQQLPSLLAASKTKTGQAANVEAKIDSDKANLQKTNSKIEELQKEFEELDAKTKGWGKFTTAELQFILKARKEQVETEIQAQEQIARDQKRVIESNKERLFYAKDQAAQASEEYNAAQDLRRKALERKAELDRQLPGQVAAASFQEQNRKDLSDIESQTRTTAAVGELGASDIGKNVMNAGAAAMALEHGQKIGADQQQLLMQLAATLKGHSVPLEQAVRLFDQVNSNQQLFLQRIAQLEKSFSQLSGQIKTSRTYPSG